MTEGCRVLLDLMLGNKESYGDWLALVRGYGEAGVECVSNELRKPGDQYEVVKSSN